MLWNIIFCQYQHSHTSPHLSSQHGKSILWQQQLLTQTITHKLKSASSKYLPVSRFYLIFLISLFRIKAQELLLLRQVALIWVCNNWLRVVITDCSTSTSIVSSLSPVSATCTLNNSLPPLQTLSYDSFLSTNNPGTEIVGSYLTTFHWSNNHKADHTAWKVGCN